MLEKIEEHKLPVIIVCIVVAIIAATAIIYSLVNNSSDVDFSTGVTNGDEKEVYNDSITVTKNDIYEYYLDNLGENEVLNLAMTRIADKEITDTKAINKQIEESKKSYAQASTDGTLATYAKSQGYTDEATFIKDAIEPDAKQQLLKNKYISLNYKSLVKTYKVRYIKTITVNTESAALNIIKQSKDAASFNKLMTSNSGTDNGLVTTENSTVDSKIIKKLSSFTKDGIYKKAIKTSESKYAVVWVYNTDTSKVKDEIIKGLANLEGISTKYEAYYLKKYEFEVYDQKLRKSIKDEYSSYLD